MTDDPEIQIDPSTGKVRIGANAYEDLRPLIQSPVKLAGGILSVVENLLGLPIDYVNICLGQFREKLRIQLEAIPEEQRQLPPLQVTSQVLREVAFCVDEESLQDMFASLLASASDTETADDAHPAFAAIIVQLTPDDAQLLEEMGDRKTWVKEGASRKQITIGKTQYDISNIARIGIVESRLNPSYWAEIRGLNDFGYQHDTKEIIERLNQVIDRLRESDKNLRFGYIDITPFGEQFRRVCCRPKAGAESGG